MEATAQLNVRIDPQLKAEGDRILAEHGLTPSRAIRSLYRSLTSGGERAERAIEAIVDPTRTNKNAAPKPSVSSEASVRCRA